MNCRHHPEEFYCDECTPPDERAAVEATDRIWIDPTSPGAREAVEGWRGHTLLLRPTPDDVEEAKRDFKEKLTFTMEDLHRYGQRVWGDAEVELEPPRRVHRSNATTLYAALMRIREVALSGDYGLDALVEYIDNETHDVLGEGNP